MSQVVMMDHQGHQSLGSMSLLGFDNRKKKSGAHSTAGEHHASRYRHRPVSPQLSAPSRVHVRGDTPTRSYVNNVDETTTFVSSLSASSGGKEEQLQEDALSSSLQNGNLSQSLRQRRKVLQDRFHGRVEEINVLQQALQDVIPTIQECTTKTTTTTLTTKKFNDDNYDTTSVSSGELEDDVEDGDGTKNKTTIFQRVKQKSRMVWVGGQSGSGKTSVVMEALRFRPMTTTNAIPKDIAAAYSTTTSLSSSTASSSIMPPSSCYFVVGKFDATRQRCEPYSALLEAFSDLSNMIVQQNMQDQQDQQYQQSVETQLLSRLVSKLSTMTMEMTKQDSKDNDASVPNSGAQNAKNMHSFTRWKLLCRNLLRSAAAAAFQHNMAVVLFLDDLHWADEGSLRVLEGFLTDSDGRNVLIVGTYRSEELAHRPLLKQLVQTTTNTTTPSSQRHSRSSLITTHLSIGVLDVETGIHPMVQTLTQVYDNAEATMELSQVVFQKTLGNAYFVVQFLQMLLDRGLFTPVPLNNHSLSMVSEETINTIPGSPSGSSQFGGLSFQQLQSQTSPNSKRIRRGGKDMPRRTYKWDMDRIRNETNVAENVAQLLEARVQRLPYRVQVVLKVAACLGYTIHVDILYSILQYELMPLVDEDETKLSKLVTNSKNNRRSLMVRSMSTETWNLDDMDRVLSQGCREGLVETYYQATNGAIKEKKYKFSHDRVQSVLYDLIPEGDEREKIHLRIGRILWKKGTRKRRIRRNSNSSNDEEEKEDWLVCMTADHLNRGVRHMSSEEERLELVRFNLHVGKIAVSKSAFGSAAEYLEFGVGIFDEDTLWQHHYELALDLMSTLSEVYHCSGNFADSRNVIETLILRRAHCLDDKLRGYYLLVESLGAQGKAVDARVLAFSVLEQLGETFPDNPGKIHVIWEFIQTKMALKRRTARDLVDSLAPMTNRKKLAAMTLLSNVFTHTFMSDADKQVFSLVGLRLMRLTLVYGLSEWSPSGIAGYAIALVAQGFFEEACAFGQAAKEISIKLGARPNDARHLLFLHQLVLHWRFPLREGLLAFPSCYDAAMINGDSDTGLCATTGYLGTAFHVGRNLEEIEESCRMYVQQMNEFDHKTYLALNVPMWQLALNLLGRSENVLYLTGEATGENNVFYQSLVEQNHSLAMQLVDYFRFLLGFLFSLGNDEGEQIMIQMLPQIESKMGAVQTHFMEYLIAFSTGLGYYVLLQRHGLHNTLMGCCDYPGRHYRRVWKRRARKSTKRLKKWVKSGVVTCRPLWMMLGAMEKSFSCHNKVFMKQLFDHALSAMEDSFEFGAPVGLAYEHASLAMLSHGWLEDASEYMTKCLDTTERFRASAKADWLRQHFGYLLKQENPAIEGIVLDIPEDESLQYDDEPMVQEDDHDYSR